MICFDGAPGESGAFTLIGALGPQQGRRKNANGWKTASELRHTTLLGGSSLQDVADFSSHTQSSWKVKVIGQWKWSRMNRVKEVRGSRFLLSPFLKILVLWFWLRKATREAKLGGVDGQGQGVEVLWGLGRKQRPGDGELGGWRWLWSYSSSMATHGLSWGGRRHPSLLILFGQTSKTMWSLDNEEKTSPTTRKAPIFMNLLGTEWDDLCILY